VVVEDGQIEHRMVAYDLERVDADLLTIDYPNAATYVSWLRNGILPTQPRSN
jgi:hypothetical protein